MCQGGVATESAQALGTGSWQKLKGLAEEAYLRASEALPRVNQMREESRMLQQTAQQQQQ